MKKKKIFCVMFILLLVMIVLVGCEEAENDIGLVDGDVSLESQLIDDLVYTNQFNSDIEMEIFWEFSQDEEELYMVLKSPASGWLAIGFEPTNRMADAKIIIAGFENETFLLEEHYGTAATSHDIIEETYIEKATGERDEDLSRAEFVIPLTGDSRYDLSAGEVYTIILGYHSSSDNFVQRHTQRTTIELEL